ncbi:hypothetical protein OfM1_00040 [Lactovum odontotermitis]
MVKKAVLKNDVSVSVLLATYNSFSTYDNKDYLEQQLNSIIQQSELPNEIIFLDDCSSDSTQSYVNEFISNNKTSIKMRQIVQRENVGYVSNFLTGIRENKNDIIIFCDQDDLWNINRVSEIKRFFRENPNMLALHSDFDVIDENNTVILKNVQGYDKKLEKLTLEKFVKKVAYAGMALAFRSKGMSEEILTISEKYNIPTHDQIICCLATIHEGFYTTNLKFSERRFTGHNVGLGSVSKHYGSVNVKNRINGIKKYQLTYEHIGEYLALMNSSDEIDLCKYKKNADIRLVYLKKNSITKWLLNLKNIRLYPSNKAYFGDLVVILKDKLSIWRNEK